MTTWRRHRTGVDSLTGQLHGLLTLATASAVTGLCKHCTTGAAVVLPGEIDDPEARIVTLDLSGWLPTAELGSWDLTWHPVFLDLSTPVWPEEGSDTVIVYL